jgi:hypothetical protein
MLLQRTFKLGSCGSSAAGSQSSIETCFSMLCCCCSLTIARLKHSHNCTATCSYLHLTNCCLFAQIKSGMSFRNFYSGSLCAISRAALLTGRDAVRTGNLFNK